MNSVERSLPNDQRDASTAAAKGVTQESPSHVPFCNKKWKLLSVRAMQASSIIFYLVNKVAQYVFYCFDLRRSYYYEKRVFYHESRFSAVSSAYTLHNNAIIDFTVNMTPIHYKGMPEELFLDRLKKTFGEDKVAQWMKMESDSLEIDQGVYYLPQAGICFGMAVDFSLHYLKEMQKGVSPREAVATISSRYVNGAPEEALLAHIFLRTLRAKNGEVEHKQEFFSITPYDQERNELIYKQMGLNSVGPLLSASTNDCNNLKLQMDKLPIGAYLTQIRPKDEAGHAIGIIKHAEGYFVLEPRHAILICSTNEIANLVLGIKQEHYEDKECSIFFTQFALQ